MGETATFVVDLKDQVSAPANSAADALERLKNKIQQESQALRDMQSAMGRLKGNTADVTAQKKLLQDRITATRSSIASAQASYLKAGGALSDLGKKTKAATGETSMLDKAVVGAGGAALAAGAILATVVAAVISFGFQAADAARSALLLRTAWAGSDAAAAGLTKEIDFLARRLPIAKAALSAIANDLMAKGLKGGGLQSALEAIGTVTAVLGPQAAGKLQAIAEQAQRTKRFVVGMFDLQGSGLTIDQIATELAANLHTSFAQAKAAIQSGTVQVDAGLKAMADAAKKRFGDIAKKQMLAIPNQIEKLKEDVADIFSGDNIEGFLEGLHEVLSLFSANTVAGKALRSLAKSILTPLGVDAKAIAPVLAGMVKGGVIGAQKLQIAYYTVKIALKKAIPPELRPNMLGIGTAANSASAAVIFLGSAFVLAAALAALPVAAFFAIQSALQRTGAYLAGLDWSSIGLNLMKGLATGIISGLTFPMNAAEQVGEKIGQALKSKLQIKSPSRVGMAIGRFFSMGVGGGIEQGAPHVERAASGLGDTAASGATSAAPRAGKSAPASVVFGDVHVHGVNADGSNLRAQFIAAVRQLLASGGLSPEGT